MLSDNLIETVERRALQDLPALKEIHLDQNLIEHLSSDAIAGTPSIRFLVNARFGSINYPIRKIDFLVISLKKAL